MAISAIKMDLRVAQVDFPAGRLEVTLRDGRVISAPLEWFPRLANASEEDRRAWETSAAGLGIHWPLADEDLSVEGLLQSGGGVE